MHFLQSNLRITRVELAVFPLSVPTKTIVAEDSKLLKIWIKDSDREKNVCRIFLRFTDRWASIYRAKFIFSLILRSMNFIKFKKSCVIS